MTYDVIKQRVINVIYHLFDFVTAFMDRPHMPLTSGSTRAFVTECRHVAYTCRLQRVCVCVYEREMERAFPCGTHAGAKKEDPTQLLLCYFLRTFKNSKSESWALVIVLFFLDTIWLTQALMPFSECIIK